jgi:hypothetical protein
MDETENSEITEQNEGITIVIPKNNDIQSINLDGDNIEIKKKGDNKSKSVNLNEKLIGNKSKSVILKDKLIQGKKKKKEHRKINNNSREKDIEVDANVNVGGSHSGSNSDDDDDNDDNDDNNDNDDNETKKDYNLPYIENKKNRRRPVNKINKEIPREKLQYHFKDKEIEKEKERQRKEKQERKKEMEKRKVEKLSGKKYISSKDIEPSSRPFLFSYHLVLLIEYINKTYKINRNTIIDINILRTKGECFFVDKELIDNLFKVYVLIDDIVSDVKMINKDSNKNSSSIIKIFKKEKMITFFKISF